MSPFAIAHLTPKLGETFGKLLFVGIVMEGNATMGLFSCSCGGSIKRKPIKVFNGNTKSCGCFQKEVIGGARRTHGCGGTKTYKIWKEMRVRCNNPNSHSYVWYGARGISICKEWDDFKTFHKDMGDCPEGGSIERLDVNGDYCPSNCVWIPHRYQGRNSRTNVLSMEKASAVRAMKREGKTMAQIAREFNTTKSCINHAVQRRTWA